MATICQKNCLHLSLLNQITYLLTPWRRVFLEKLTDLQLKKFPSLYGTRMFITALTSARHLSHPEPAHSSPHTHIPLPEDPF
jgi:hypothetical protein